MFDDLLKEGKELYNTVRSDWATDRIARTPQFEIWLAKARGTLIAAYGKNSEEVNRWDELQSSFFDDEPTDSSVLAYTSIDHVRDCLAVLVEYKHAHPSTTAATESARRVKNPHEPSHRNRVFIIHGHDPRNALVLEKLLRVRFGLDPVVLVDEPGGGRTIIEKFEEEAATCGFAFALLTPDDQVRTNDGEYTQARPNVVFELGWFYARLGRGGVAILQRKGTQIHSDLKGIECYEFEGDVTEQVMRIEDELIRAGMLSPRR